MSRRWLIVPALLFLGWTLYATWRWLSGFDTLNAAVDHLIAAATADWMLALFLTDMALLSIGLLIWLLRDAGERGLSAAARLGLALAIILFGTTAALMYLALRPEAKIERPAGDERA